MYLDTFAHVGIYTWVCLCLRVCISVHLHTDMCLQCYEWPLCCRLREHLTGFPRIDPRTQCSLSDSYFHTLRCSCTNANGELSSTRLGTSRWADVGYRLGMRVERSLTVCAVEDLALPLPPKEVTGTSGKKHGGFCKLQTGQGSVMFISGHVSSTFTL